MPCRRDPDLTCLFLSRGAQLFSQWSGSGDQKVRKAEWWIGQKYFASATAHLMMLSWNHFEIRVFFV